MINLPTYRAKSKEQKNAYVEGLLIGVDEELNLCTIRTKDDYIGGELCYLHTLSINFPNMVDVKGNKIFASLQEDGRGGDILFDMEYEYTLSYDGLKYNLQGLFSQSSFNEFDSWEAFDVIGIEDCSIINDIYDDFESRSCENCKHHIVNIDERIIWCNLEEGYLEDCRVDKTFGCNRWEPRDDR